MSIDWFTFVAQVVNFFILVYLLRRFLYGPIVEAMDVREAGIAAAMREADAARDAAVSAEADYRSRRHELDEKRQELVAQAEQEAEGRKKDLIHQARAEIGDQQARWREALRQEKASFLKDLRQRSSEQIWELARRVLGDLADTELERQIVEVFVRRLGSLEREGRQALIDAIAEGGDTVTVASSFPLAEDARARMTSAVHAHIAVSLRVAFVESPDVVAGVELKAGGHKVAWSIGDYLLGLEESLTDAVESEIARMSTGPATVRGDQAAPAAARHAARGDMPECDEDVEGLGA